jgi:hypothetical protein
MDKGSGSLGRRRIKDEHRAAAMKAAGIERTTGRCAQCYRLITVDSRISTYRHICK